MTIPSPTSSETVVKTPAIPGLELHLPAGTVIRGEDGEVVRIVTITPIPLDRTPFPLPSDAQFNMFFTIQPGGAYIHTSGTTKGAWLVYPNTTSFPAGTRVPFFDYDPDSRGWHGYGMGVVTTTQVVPEPKTRIYAFTGASFGSGSPPPAGGATPGGSPTADPVDPSTGAFIMEKTDLYLPDVMPVTLTRTYNSQDAFARAFGTGMTHSYGLLQYTENFDFSDGYLILPDGGRIYYVRISDPSLPWYATVFEAQSTPTQFYKSRIIFNGNAYEVQLKDGTVYVMGHAAPLQTIRDRYGNETRLTWSDTNIFGAGYGNLLRITSPNGRWIEFSYYAGTSRVSQAKDNIGRTVSYTYDASGRLETVTDPENNVTTYMWDASSRLRTIKDGRNIVYLTNDYNANGRVITQTLADPNAHYTFAYTTDTGGNITRTDVTNPRNLTTRFNFNADHQLVSKIEALNQPEQRTTTFERASGNDLVTAIVDGLNRRTEYEYDDFGHVRTLRQLAGTPDVVSTIFTYEPKFFQLASLTDALNHTWSVGYDSAGRIASGTDPLTHQTTFATNVQGLVTGATDPLQHTWQFGYAGADRTSMTNPVGAVWRSFVDGAGRVLSTTDPLGRVTRLTPDKLNRVRTVSDAMGGQTSLDYDPNGRVLALTDAQTHSTGYTYDMNDRLATRSDPLQHAATYTYDRNDNLTQITDRKEQVTRYEYDALDRLKLVTYADTSTTQYVYDAGDRVRQIIDSISGTITRDYDLLGRLTSETTSEGSIAYTYDLDGRRETMTVAGQPVVTYGYDDAHRLTSITQGTNMVSMTYDDANRRTTLTLPNGIVTTSDYDNANQLTGLTYTLGSTTLGTLTYTYDGAGSRTSVGGVWARTGLPQPLASATYDAANRIASWAGQAFSYDPNGNLASDGATNYSWNARNQLIGLSGGTSATFAYDALERRRSKTVGGTTTNFLYDGENPVQELTSGGTPTANLLTGLGLDQTFTRTDASGTSTLLIDALGSALALADTSGAVQTQYTFDPFGTTTASGAASANAFQFTGRENDGAGLYFYRARFYSLAVQRFVSEDPVEFLGGLNLYEYAGSNPIRYKDPLGWSRKEDCPKCVDMFRDCLTDWLLPGLSNAIQGLMEAFANSASIYEFNAALMHALSRGLTYPQKSSIFRDLIKNSRWWTTISEAAGPAVFTAGVWYCLGKEMNALAHGECRP